MIMCRIDVTLHPGCAPLIFASRHNRLPVVKHLLELMANIEAKDIYGVFLISAPAVLGLHICGGRMCWWMRMCVWLM